MIYDRLKVLSMFGSTENVTNYGLLAKCFPIERFVLLTKNKKYILFTEAINNKEINRKKK